MKSIFYVGAMLMVGASIYVFIDYKKASGKAEFKNMYESKDVKEEPAQKILEVTEEMPALKIEEPLVEKTKVEVVPVPKEENSSISNRKFSKKKKSEKRKLSSEKFSRGRL